MDYQWSLNSKPASSTSSLSADSGLSVTLLADLAGNYVVQLIARDDLGASASTSLAIAVDADPKPTANAGPDQAALLGDSICLDGSSSSDPQNQSLSFLWSFTSAPAGSAAALDDLSSETPCFVVDVIGTYVVQLIVNDGLQNSEPDTVSITDNTPPVAEAGDSIEAFLGAPVSLDGTASSEDIVSYSWSVINQPVGSTVGFNNNELAEPILIVSGVGEYQIQLSVSDGIQEHSDTLLLTVIDGDQDGDGVLSSEELLIGSNPNFPDSDGNGTDDGDEDFDSDNLPNRWERLLAYDLADEDTDDNGTLDGDEDYDGDGFSNAVEIAAGSAPNNAGLRPYYLDFLVKSAPAVPGGHLETIITLANSTANTTFNNLVFSITVPVGLSFNRLNDVALKNSTSHTGCLANGFCDSGDTVRWSLANIAPGESWTFHIDATVGDAVTPGTSITLPLVVSADEFAADIVRNRTVNVVAEEEVFATLTASKDPVVPGESFSYTIAFGNAGNVPVTDAEINFILPAGLSVATISDAGTQSGWVITWDIANLAPTQSLVRVLDVVLDTGIAVGSSLTAQAVLRYAGGGDIDRVLEVPVSVAAASPLTVDYQLLSSPVTPGGLLTYLLTLSNTSPASLLNDITLQLRVPDGVSFNRFYDVAYRNSNAQANCAANGHCDAGDEVFWNVAASVTPGTVISTPMFISASELPDVIYLEQAAAVVVGQDAQFALTASQDPVAPGETFEYRLDFGNAGNAVFNNATLSLALPEGLTALNISDDGEQNGDSVSWTLTSINSTDSVVRTVSVSLDETATVASTLTAMAELRHSGGLEIDRRLSLPVSVSQAPLLQLDYEILAAPVTPGGKLTYAVTVSNTGVASLIENLGLELIVPTGVSFNRLYDVAFLNSTGQANCAANGFCDAGDEVFWTLDQLAAGQSVTLHIDATVDADVTPGTVITTPLFVRADNLNDDIQLLRTASVVAAQDVQFTLSASQDPVAPGQTYRYQLDFGNAGNLPVNNAELDFIVPEGLTVVAIGDGGVQTGNRIRWSVASLNPTLSLFRTVTITLDDNTSLGSSITAHAELRHDGGLALDRRLATPVTVSSPLLLDVDYELLSAPVTPGGHLTYLITLSNTGVASLIENVRLQLVVPDGVSFNRTYDAAYMNSNGQSNCAANGFCNAGDEVFWTIDKLAAWQSVTINVEATVDADISPGTLIQSPIFVRAGDLGDDIYFERTSAVMANQNAQFAVTTSQDPVAPGANFNYQVTLGNAGNSAISDAVLSLELPENLSVVGLSDEGSVSSNAVSWSVASLAAAQSLVRTVIVNLDTNATLASSLTAVAGLRHADGLEVDRVVHTPVTVNGSLPLAVSFDAELTEQPGGSVALQVIVTNNTLVDIVDNVSVMLRVPEGISFNRLNDAIPASNAQTNCAANGFCDAGDEVFWNFSQLPAGASETVTVSALVAAGVDPGSLIRHMLFINANGLADSIYREQTTRIISP